jgi:ADP-heptose:LPS heptosyltransferase
MGPAAAIRRHHGDAEITLLTTGPFAELARAAPYFDRVWIDGRPSLAHPFALARLRRRLRTGGFERVYDLQTSDRSSFYFHLMGPGKRPEWSGIARGASHPHANANRDFLHTLDRQADQLKSAGIETVPAPDLMWAASDLGRFDLPARFMALVPGGAPHRPEKRWPVGHYGELARIAAAAGVAPVVIGGAAEAGLGAAIRQGTPSALDLTGRTSFGDVVAIGARAVHAVGNDTGPMHLLVAGGASATILYSAASDPALTAPRGRVTILRRDRLDDLTVAEVAATLPVG